MKKNFTKKDLRKESKILLTILIIYVLLSSVGFYIIYKLTQEIEYEKGVDKVVQCSNQCIANMITDLGDCSFPYIAKCVNVCIGRS